MYNESKRFFLNLTIFVFVTLSFSMAKAQDFGIQFKGTDNMVLEPSKLEMLDSMGLPVRYLLAFGIYTPLSNVFDISAVFDNNLVFRSKFKNGICCRAYVFKVYPQNEFMEAVIIGIDKEKSQLQQATVSTSVLKPYLIENKITNNFTEILDQMPGVSVTDNQLNIRNGAGWSYGAGSRTLIAVDEIPMLTGDAANAMWSFLPQEITGSAELIKSAGSVVYGSSALNGVFNVRTIEAGEKDKLNIASNFGVFNRPSLEQRYSKTPQVQAGLSGYYTTRQNNNDWVFHWNYFYDYGYRLNEQDNRGRLGVKFKHVSKKVKGLSYGLNQSLQYGKSGSFLLWESHLLPYTSLDSGYNFSYGTRYHLDPFIELKGLRSSHKLISRLLHVNNRVVDDNPNTDNSNGSNLIYAEYKFKHYLGKVVTLNFGMVGMHSGTNSPLYTTAQTTTNIAPYAQAEFKKKRWIINAGGRYEYFKMGTAQQKPVFRLGANYHAAKATFLRASAGQGFRFPSIAEAFTQTSVGPVSIYANPNLNPETSMAYEIGVKQGIRTNKLSGFVDLALFQTTLSDMIEYTFGQWDGVPLPPSFGAGFKALNAGRGQVRGAEIEIMAQYKGHKYDWILLTGYTYSDAQNLEPDKTIATETFAGGRALNFRNTSSDTTLFLKYRYRHLFKIDWQYNRKIWMAGISARYQSRMENIDAAFQNFPISIFVPGVAQTRERMGNALVFDLRLGYKINSRFDINTQIRNVLNTQYFARPADVKQPRLFQLQIRYTL
jgi:iron complex outermembrane receptor protein